MSFISLFFLISSLLCETIIKPPSSLLVTIHMEYHSHPFTFNLFISIPKVRLDNK